jgi:hypothetical protein
MGDDPSQLVSASLCVLVILSDARNLYLFFRQRSNDNQRCFASLNMTG